MKTTELFAELLIIGLGALVWISFFTIGIFGIEPIEHVLESERVNQIAVVLLGASAAYVLGIVVDRAYLPLWRGYEADVMKRRGITLEGYYDFQIDLAMNGSDELVAFMDYYSSRLRVLRASTVNFLMAAPLGAYAFSLTYTVALFVFFGSLVVSIASASAYCQLTNKYYGFVRRVASKFETDLGNRVGA